MAQMPPHPSLSHPQAPGTNTALWVTPGISLRGPEPSPPNLVTSLCQRNLFPFSSRISRAQRVLLNTNFVPVCSEDKRSPWDRVFNKLLSGVC